MPSDIYLVPGTYSGSVSWSNTALWSGGVVPTTNDRVYLLGGSGLIFDQGVNQGTSYLALLFSDDMGPQLGGTGTNYAQIPAALQVIGAANTTGRSGTGTARWKNNSGTWASTVNLITSADAAAGETSLPPVCLLGSNAANAFYMSDGVAGIAVINPTETANWPTISLDGGTFALGGGGTNAVFTNNGADATLRAGPANLIQLDGFTLTTGTYGVDAVTNRGGTLTLNHRPSSGTMVKTLLLDDPKAVLDMTGNPSAFSFGASTFRRGKVKVFNDGQQNFGTTTVSLNNFTTVAFTLSN